MSMICCQDMGKSTICCQHFGLGYEEWEMSMICCQDFGLVTTAAMMSVFNIQSETARSGPGMLIIAIPLVNVTPSAQENNSVSSLSSSSKPPK